MGDLSAYTLNMAANFFQRDYQDRGMVKWGGFALSDHTEDVNKYTAQRAQRMQQARMPEMSSQAMLPILEHAFANHELVQIQQASKQDQQIPALITGFVQGYTELGVVIGATEIEYADLWWVSLASLGTI